MQITKLHKVLLTTIPEILHNEFGLARDEDNEIPAVFSGQYTVKFDNILNKAPREIGFYLVKLCLSLVNGDLSQHETNWLFDRSIGYYYRATVTQAQVSYRRNALVLSKADRDWILQQLDANDRILFYRRQDV
jgi:hypothetical protein